MTGSRRRSPFVSYTGDSAKWYKSWSSRRKRRQEHVVLGEVEKMTDVSDVDIVIDERKYGDPMTGPKDGYIAVDPDSKWMRK